MMVKDKSRTEKMSDLRDELDLLRTPARALLLFPWEMVKDDDMIKMGYMKALDWAELYDPSWFEFVTRNDEKLVIQRTKYWNSRRHRWQKAKTTAVTKDDDWKYRVEQGMRSSQYVMTEDEVRDVVGRSWAPYTVYDRDGEVVPEFIPL